MFARPAGQLSTGLWTWLVLLTLSALVVLERAHTYDEPLNRDLCGYAIIGHEMLRGRHLYADLWERKPPLLYATFAAAEVLVGYGQQEVFVVNVAAALLTLAGIYAVGRAGGGTVGGLIAAGMFALVGADLLMEANQPNAESFINPCLTWAVALLAGWPTGRFAKRRLARATLVGALIAAATLYKHHVAVIGAALLLGHVLATSAYEASTTDGSRGKRTRLAEALVAGGVVVLTWAGVFAFFAAAGRLHDMVDVLFRANDAYADGIGRNLFRAATQTVRLFPPFMGWGLQPLLVIGVWLGFVTARRRWSTIAARPWLIWASWAAGAWVAVALPGKLYAHYYQFWIPVLCVGAGWAGAGLMRAELRVPITVVAVLFAAVLIALGLPQGRRFALSPQDWARAKYPDDNIAEEQLLGEQLRTALRPGETLWVLGEDTPLYFYARCDPPTGLFYLQPLMQTNGPGSRWPQLMNDLRRTPPALVVISRFWVRLFPTDAPVFPWLSANYRPVYPPLSDPTYVLFMRNQKSGPTTLP